MENRKGVSEPGDYQQAVRERLNELRDRYGLSEISRRTLTPLTNVHRYMREGKVPAEFCAALVDAFEVNPAWLLTGAQGTLLSEVNPDTARLGGDLLELVNAMNAVARMRIGALAGREHEKKLRELGDALDTYERLRERMNSKSRPLLAELVDRFHECNNEMQLERGAHVRKAALQVSRFCDDPELLRRLDSVQAYHEHLSGRVDAALAIHQRLFARRMAEGGVNDAQACDAAANYVLALRDSGRFQEGLRVAEAAMLLASDEVRASELFIELECIAGAFQMELGELAQGLARIQRAYQRTAPAKRGFVAIFLSRVELLADLATLRDVRLKGFDSRGRTRLLIRQAALVEDVEELGLLLKDGIGDGPDQVPANEYESRRGRLIHLLLTGRKGDHLGAYHKLIEESPPPVNSLQLREVLARVHVAQAARLAGSTKAAEKATLEAQKAIEAVPPDRAMMVDLLGLHARNVRESLKAPKHRALQQRWSAYLDDRIRAGYGFLRYFQ
ncbi:MAG: hypothetical protein KDB90_16050 [Planctomycetes bacterium]|nr:hypothetical protein [Planctomycetota bacterium]